MYFDDEFLKSLPDDIFSTIMKICEQYKNLYDKEAIGLYEKHVLAKEALGFLAAYFEATGLKIALPDITGDLKTDNENAYLFFERLKGTSSKEISQTDFERYKSFFAAKLGKVFHYEFSEGDIKLIQNLIDELRDLISKTEELEEDHRQRLIRKLEKVQSELHKRISDLDRFWGFCIDLSIVVGMMGENAKPAADLVKKIVDVIWPAQTRAYELSSSLPFKLLGQIEDDKSKGKE